MNSNSLYTTLVLRLDEVDLVMDGLSVLHMQHGRQEEVREFCDNHPELSTATNIPTQYIAARDEALGGRK